MGPCACGRAQCAGPNFPPLSRVAHMMSHMGHHPGCDCPICMMQNQMGVNAIMHNAPHHMGAMVPHHMMGAMGHMNTPHHMGHMGHMETPHHMGAMGHMGLMDTPHHMGAMAHMETPHHMGAMGHMGMPHHMGYHGHFGSHGMMRGCTCHSAHCTCHLCACMHCGKNKSSC